MVLATRLILYEVALGGATKEQDARRAFGMAIVNADVCCEHSSTKYRIASLANFILFLDTICCCVACCLTVLLESTAAAIRQMGCFDFWSVIAICFVGCLRYLELKKIFMFCRVDSLALERGKVEVGDLRIPIDVTRCLFGD